MAKQAVSDRSEPHPGQCPGRDQLFAFSRGELASEALDAICRHIADCPSCETALATLEEADDVIVANLRKYVDHQPWILREEYQKLEARAKAIAMEGMEPSPAASSENDAAKDTRDQLVPPAQLGKYQLLEELGHGGMGVVYAARHTNLNRKFALKVMRSEFTNDASVRARFRREREAIGALVHTNIVTATDADEAEGHHFLVMELVDGLDLDSLLKQTGTLPVAEACEIIRQAAFGLQCVYENQRVHRDLKPSNLMLSAEGVVKILDLGLARIHLEGEASEELTHSNLAMGTADYMAPEQWEDSRTVDIRADIYSLGCTLYKLLVGHAPFSASEFKPMQRKKYAHTHISYPPLASVRPDAPAGLCEVLDRMLEKDPAGRYATPKDVTDALAPFAEGCNCRRLISAAMERSVALAPGGQKVGGTAAETVGVRQPTPGGLRGTTSGGSWTRAIGKRWRLVGGVAIAASLLAGGLAFGLNWFAADDTPNHQPDVPVSGPAKGGPRPGVPVLLLQEEPTRLFWKDLRGDHLFQLKADRRQMWVNAPYIGLLGIGKADSPDYRIQLGISQTPWQGGVGLFFGYHKVVVANKPSIKYLRFEIKPSAKGDFKLFRYQGTLVYEKEELRWGSDNGTLGQAPLGQLTDREESLLIVQVRNGKLDKVLWNTNDLTNHFAKYEARLKAEDYIGEFGTYNNRSSATFGSAQYLLFER